MSLQDALTIAGAFIVSLGGGAAIVVAAAKWLADVFANRILESDRHKYQEMLAKLSNELEMSRQERHVRFSLLHERRAQVVAEFYARLSRASQPLARLVNLFQLRDAQPLSEKKEEVAKVCGEAASYYYENKIWLDPEVCESADAVLEEMYKAFVAFDVAHSGDNYDTGLMDLWKLANDKVGMVLPPLMKQLEQQFRSLLGASP